MIPQGDIAHVVNMENFDRLKKQKQITTTPNRRLEFSDKTQIH